MRKKHNLDERLSACKDSILFRLYAESPPPDFRIDGGDSRRVLEIGCGKGTFAFRYAAAHPDTAVYAVEKDTNVLITALEQQAAFAREHNYDTAMAADVHFIAGDALYLPRGFADDTIDEIFLNFSTPFPKARQAAQRLTHPRFLRIFSGLLKQGGVIRLKTDNDDFFDYSLKSLCENGFELIFVTRDLHGENSPAANFENKPHNYRTQGNIITEYEQKFMSAGIPIKSLAAVNRKPR